MIYRSYRWWIFPVRKLFSRVPEGRWDLTTILMVIFREDLPSDYLMGSSNGILMEWNRIIIHFLWDIPSGNWLQIAIEAMAHL